VAKDNLADLAVPYNLEAEKAILGSMLLEKEAIEIALEVLSENDFYATAHKAIFRELIKIYDRNQSDVDILLLYESLKLEQSVEQLGGKTYLTTLVDTVITASNAEHYANIVKDKAVLRELIHAGRKMIGDAVEQAADVNEIVDSASQSIFNISDRKLKKGPVSVAELINPTVKSIEELSDRKEHIPGVPSGFADLDEITGGFKKSNLIIIAGRPGTGKTSLAMNIAENAAILHGKSVMVFSLEMSIDELMMRFICSEARVASDKIKNGYFSKGDWPKITTAAGKFKSTKIFMEDSSALNVLEMKARARRLIRKGGLDLVIIDYLQLMSGKTGRSEFRQLDVAEISRQLKIMSKDLDIPVIALSQLSRKPEERGGVHGGGQAGRPRLSDLRESGAIEQDADLVLMLYNPNLYKSEDGIEAANPVSNTEIIIAKNRHGRMGNINLQFRKEYTKFESTAKGSG